MPEYDLCFSSASTIETGSYKLVELTPDLAKLIEDGINNDLAINLTIKGNPQEDAVLCTKDKTYSMRSVNLSNTVVVATAVPDIDACNNDFSNDAVVIRDQVKEIIELAPAVPKLHKLMSLIRERVYDEGQEDDDDDPSIVRFTLDTARREIQASEVELERGLKDRRILVLNNELRPIAVSYLIHLLELILAVLVAASEQHASASVESITSQLEEDHEVPRVVSTQVMGWFGDIVDGKWKMDVDSVVKEIGLGILRNHRHDPIEKGLLMTKWKSLVGDTFESSVSLPLLAGNYIEVETLGSTNTTLKYFPASSLPIDPAGRFAELFAMRSKWKGEEISPFLADIAVNNKERDKLLLKYCRAVTDSHGIRYTARAQYNG
ncbi:hypothetical protein CVT24_003987 [Panaeolus cyanescens]|uniref:Sister chromatid cohesion protein DCC1 n=1 Tax=Panaeolus cyanescens TaxID=181874 RepID=A0A409Y639_9AGAR|nr:hypothetical protein CVT24_003987 [Panaeolus cyanescens]